MMAQSVRSLIRRVAPRPFVEFVRARRLHHEAQVFREHLASARTWESKVDLAIRSEHFRSNQKRAEILALLDEVARLKPRRVCEIGTNYGGTLALIAAASAEDARILSLDLVYPAVRRACHRTFTTARQTIDCWQVDSHLPDTLGKVRQWLGGEPLDFLFIDGDHSYAGVKADYEMYGPLVRPGGLIAFHDIVPVDPARHAEIGNVDVGEVPRFWRELRAQIPAATEFIEDPNQGGYGLGVIRVCS